MTEETKLAVDTLCSSLELIMMDKARQEGRQKGHHEGRLQSLRESILAVLEGRFGTISALVGDRLQKETSDVALLRGCNFALGIFRSEARKRRLWQETWEAADNPQSFTPKVVTRFWSRQKPESRCKACSS